MEAVVERENMLNALRRVVSNMMIISA